MKLFFLGLAAGLLLSWVIKFACSIENITPQKDPIPADVDQGITLGINDYLHWFGYAVVMWVLFSLIIFFLGLFGFAPWDKLGQFGDTFNVLNALASSLAFAAVAIALLLQVKATHYQLEDLKISKDEMKKSTEAQQGSRDAHAQTVTISAISSLIDTLNIQIREQGDFVQLLRNETENAIGMRISQFECGPESDKVVTLRDFSASLPVLTPAWHKQLNTDLRTSLSLLEKSEAAGWVPEAYNLFRHYKEYLQCFEERGIYLKRLKSMINNDEVESIYSEE